MLNVKGDIDELITEEDEYGCLIFDVVENFNPREIESNVKN